MSGLANYVSGTREIAQELRMALESSEVEALRTLLLGKSSRDWMSWRVHNHDLVCEFVAATPSQRKKLKKFQENWLLLSLAGFHHCKEASVLLNVITSPPLQPGSSYREMAALAGDAYNRIFDEDVPDWPFEQVSSPFQNAV